MLFCRKLFNFFCFNSILNLALSDRNTPRDRAIAVHHGRDDNMVSQKVYGRRVGGGGCGDSIRENRGRVNMQSGNGKKVHWFMEGNL